MLCMIVPFVWFSVWVFILVFGSSCSQTLHLLLVIHGMTPFVSQFETSPSKDCFKACVCVCLRVWLFSRNGHLPFYQFWKRYLYLRIGTTVKLSPRLGTCKYNFDFINLTIHILSLLPLRYLMGFVCDDKGEIPETALQRFLAQEQTRQKEENSLKLQSEAAEVGPAPTTKCSGLHGILSTFCLEFVKGFRTARLAPHTTVLPACFQCGSDFTLLTWKHCDSLPHLS